MIAAASPIAADRLESGENSSMQNLTYNNSILLASSGGETVLSSTLSEAGGIFSTARANGTRVQLREGYVQDAEIVNDTRLAYIFRNLTSEGIEAKFRIENRKTGERVKEFSISREVNDVERVGDRYYFGNSSGVYPVENQSNPVTDLELEDEADVVDIEFSGNSTLLATQGPNQIIVKDRDSSKRFNISRPEDMQLIDLDPLNILVVHNSEVVEYRELNGSLEKVWSYSGLENGRAVNRLPNNNTIIADRNTVSSVNSSGEEVWEKKFFSASDIESHGDKVYSLANADSGADIDSYWSPSIHERDKAQLGILKGFLQARFNSVFS